MSLDEVYNVYMYNTSTFWSWSGYSVLQLEYVFMQLWMSFIYLVSIRVHLLTILIHLFKCNCDESLKTYWFMLTSVMRVEFHVRVKLASLCQYYLVQYWMTLVGNAEHWFPELFHPCGYFIVVLSKDRKLNVLPHV